MSLQHHKELTTVVTFMKQDPREEKAASHRSVWFYEKRGLEFTLLWKQNQTSKVLSFFLPVPSVSPLLGWVNPPRLLGYQKPCLTQAQRETYPSSTMTEFMRRQLVMVTLSCMTQDEPMTERLTDDFSPTCVSGPTRLSAATCRRQTEILPSISTICNSPPSLGLASMDSSREIT